MKPLLTVTAAALLGMGFFLARASAAPALSDVPPDHWAAAAVHRLAVRKIMVGTPGGKFQGNQPVTRYELAVTLDRLVRALEAARKPLSVARPPQVGVALPPAAPDATKRALAHLTQGGFITPGSPLLLQSDGVVTARELTAILSGIVIRLSDRSLPPTVH